MKKKLAKAFSLIEVAVSITVLGLVIAAIVPAINSALRRARISNYKAVAHRLAQERIEQLTGTNFNSDFYDGLFNLTTGNPWNDTVFHLLGNNTFPGNEAYGNLSLNTSDPDDPFSHYSRLTEGSWDLDQDGTLDNEKLAGRPLTGMYGNLSLVRVSVSWDFNEDGVDDYEPVVVTTFKAGSLESTCSAMNLVNTPFLDNSTDLCSEPDKTLPASFDGTLNSRITPYTAGTLTINANVGWANCPSYFILANSVVLDGSPTVYAEGKTNSTLDGGSGGSGGGGGGGFCGFGFRLGGNGGSGGNGIGACGAGGTGCGNSYNSGFTYGTGGSGGNAVLPGGVGGAGGNGFGGGGGGGTVAPGLPYGQGGGGGGGLIVIVTSSLSGGGTLNAAGGNATGLSFPGGGGGGVIWIAAESYDGSISADVNRGTNDFPVPIFNATSGIARIFQLNTDGSLTARNFTDTW
ncbi:MAG: type II secretion system protein [Candidatus Omnitrophota bacterium]